MNRIRICEGQEWEAVRTPTDAISLFPEDSIERLTNAGLASAVQAGDFDGLRTQLGNSAGKGMTYAEVFHPIGDSELVIKIDDVHPADHLINAALEHSFDDADKISTPHYLAIMYESHGSVQQSAVIMTKAAGVELFTLPPHENAEILELNGLDKRLRKMCRMSIAERSIYKAVIWELHGGNVFCDPDISSLDDLGERPITIIDQCADLRQLPSYWPF